jgi:hypothetical protein
VNFRALHEAFDHEDVKLRLKDNPRCPETFVPKSQYTTMAMLEMLTGCKTEYVFRRWNTPGPQMIRTGHGNPEEYEQDFTSEEKYPAFQDWILGPDDHTLPTPNWNPTVILSIDSGLRALKPFPDNQPGDPFTYLYLQDSRAARWPYDLKQGDENYDRATNYEVLYSGTVAMVWIARLKIDLDNKAPLSTASRMVRGVISQSEYFKLDDSITEGT